MPSFIHDRSKSSMLNLISIKGKSAQTFFLEQHVIPDFKAALRTIVAGRILIVSTKFQSDLVYNSENSNNDSILKLWAFYANAETHFLQKQDLVVASGNNGSLTKYFQSLHVLSANWYQYLLYRKAFLRSLQNDQFNPITLKILDCEQQVLRHPHINRAPLISPSSHIKPAIFKNTDSLAKRITNNDLHLN